MSHPPDGRRDISTTIKGEYLEMPGLRLTLAQAARLFSMKPGVIEAALDRLVASSFLRHMGAFYARADSRRRPA